MNMETYQNKFGEVKTDQGRVIEYREQYEGYSSFGWSSNHDEQTAYETLISVNPDLIGAPMEVDTHKWSIDTESGTYYYDDDPSGTKVAGVLFPDGSNIEQVAAEWRAAMDKIPEEQS